MLYILPAQEEDMSTFQASGLWPESQRIMLCGQPQVPLCTLLSFLLVVSLPLMGIHLFGTNISCQSQNALWSLPTLH